MSSPLVIIGSGLAGYSVAREYRRLDKTREILMLTQDDGAYYSKPQLSIALAKQQTAAQLIMKTSEQMAQQLNIKIITNVFVESLDCINKKIYSAQTEYAYSQCVLAVGADPIHRAFAGDAASEMVSINNLTDYAHFRQWLQDKKNIAIIGAGLVGCEMMNDLISTNYNVTMVSLEKYSFRRFFPIDAMEACWRQVYTDLGVRWNFDQQINSIDYLGEKISINLTDGQTVVADGVISALGITARTELAQAAALNTAAGIVINDLSMTSDDNVFALGDCAELNGCLYQYVAPILHSARALAKTLNGNPTKVIYPPMPVVIKTTKCPVVAQLPAAIPAAATWQREGDGANQSAKLLLNDKLLGFVLMGTMVDNRMTLLKQLAAGE